MGSEFVNEINEVVKRNVDKIRQDLVVINELVKIVGVVEYDDFQYIDDTNKRIEITTTFGYFGYTLEPVEITFNGEFVYSEKQFCVCDVRKMNDFIDEVGKIMKYIGEVGK